MRGRRPGARVGPRGFSDDADEARAVRDAWNATALGHRFARDLLDIGGERNRRRGADRHPDAIGVDRALRGLELTDPRCVQSSRDEYPDVAEPGLVEPSPDLFDEIDRHPAALTRRVQPHAAQPRAESLGHAERLFGLI